MTARIATLGALLFGAFASLPVAAQELGWDARIEGRGGERVTTVFEHAAFVLGAKESLNPVMPAADLTLDLSTALVIRPGGRYRFELTVRGGSAVFDVPERADAGCAATPAAVGRSDWLELERGELGVRVRFQRDGDGPASLQLRWELENTKAAGFPREPVPARFTHRTSGTRDVGLVGRALLGEAGCVSCHALTGAAAEAVRRLPAPRLAAAGQRYASAWLERWIVDPRAVDPGARMPALLAGRESAAEDARALAAFLIGADTAGDGAQDEGSAENGDAALGRSLFHTLGCVACHGALSSPGDVFGDPLWGAEIPDVGRFALRGLENKWRPAALAAFLREPHVVRPDGRMPSLALDDHEAASIASYLTEHFGPAPANAEPPAELVARGERLFSELACSSCHDDLGVQAPAARAPLATLTAERGCLDPEDAATPRYGFDAAEREALAAGLRDVAATVSSAPRDRAERTLEAFACRACHTLAGPASGRGAGGVHDELDVYFVSNDDKVDLGDEGRLPPDLSGVGFKLRTSWLNEVLTGAGRARPYLAARMPSYRAEDLGELAVELAHRAGVEAHADALEPRASDELVLAGRRLLAHENLGCMECHVFGDYPPTGTPGADITRFAERLRYAWYEVFLQNPQRYKPGSRMPDFGTGGLSSLRTFFEGDMHRQAEAMWSYFGLGDGMLAPEGVEPGGGLPILVGERPIVFRSFLEEAGTRGIAVGLPVGVHFGYDGRSARLVNAWRGDFLEASGSWAGRGGNEVGGQGAGFWKAPPGPTLWIADTFDEAFAERALDYRGYRLDASGHPSFLARCEGAGVTETFTARVAPELVLVRRLELAGLAGRKVFVDPGTSDEARVAWRRQEGLEWAGVHRTEDKLWQEFQPIGERETVVLEWDVTP